ncbi:beta-class carbonic anhydrase [Gorillibacterium massiliense]|uniref:beta-class carbonic anhydrase n=1 Tax=Gorillibacterium massiliense TaxID=1280390 RepID=UPI0004AFAC41|nr:carbonic anhydrase [Gorillibacterium massiliense]
MSRLNDILEFNRGFVQDGEYRKYSTDKFPDKKIAILTCMDTRLTELLPKAMNLRNGDAKIIKTAGGLVAHPFGSVMRSILVAIYQLNAEEVYVIGHHDCGMTGLNPDEVLSKAVKRGISEETLHTLSYSGVDLDRFLTGFENVQDTVKASVKAIRNHPLLPQDIKVYGLVIHPETGQLDLIAEDEDGVQQA